MSTENLIAHSKKHAGWSIFMGVLTSALGAFLIAYPLATAKVATALLGWVLILVAITQLIFALHSRAPGGFFPKFLNAVVFGIIGLALAFAPLEGVEALTAMLGVLLLIQAGLATVTAFQIRPLTGWGWFLVEAATSFALGMLILVEWPSSSVWAIGMLVGVAVLMGGIVRIVVAAKIRSGASSLERLFSSGAGMSGEARNTQGSVS